MAVCMFNEYVSKIKAGYSIEDISKYFHVLPESVILSLATNSGLGKNNIIISADDNRIYNAIRTFYNNIYNQPALNINSDRMVIISDSHIGRHPEGYYTIPSINEDGLYAPYEFADENGIHDIIHLGDFIEGESDSTMRNCRFNLDFQLDYLDSIYPDYPGIDTSLLYGNHDFNAFHYSNGKYNDYFLENYLGGRNIKIIGGYYRFLNFCGYKVRLAHFFPAFRTEFYYHDLINELDRSMLQKTVEFTLSGHSHAYSFSEKDRFIDAPPLFCYRKECEDNSSFLEVINSREKFTFNVYNQEKELIKTNTLNK